MPVDYILFEIVMVFRQHKDDQRKVNRYMIFTQRKELCRIESIEMKYLNILKQRGVWVINVIKHFNLQPTPTTVH